MSSRIAVVAVSFVCVAGGCASPPAPHELVGPTPLEGSGGKYLCPYTSDGQLAPWARRAIDRPNARRKAEQQAVVAQVTLLTIVAMAWAGGNPVIAGDAGMEQVLRKEARKAALKDAGGDAFMRVSSDGSFGCVEDLAVYLYVNRRLPRLASAEKLVRELYPEYAGRRLAALMDAKRKPKTPAATTARPDCRRGGRWP